MLLCGKGDPHPRHVVLTSVHHVVVTSLMAPLRPVGAKPRWNRALLSLLGVGVLFGLYYHHSIMVFTSGLAIAPSSCSQASSCRNCLSRLLNVRDWCL